MMVVVVVVLCAMIILTYFVTFLNQCRIVPNLLSKYKYALILLQVFILDIVLFNGIATYIH